PRWIPNLRRMESAFRDMDAATRRGGLFGRLGRMAASARAMAAFVALYTIPVKRNALPASTRLEPAY
ncbi:MAG: magnesium-protoporphyrin IX monomethyl ester (oxidative) cyclase, partial [Gemmobacter sp.]